MADKHKNLFYLHDLTDYKVAHNYPDVRGWNVKDKEGRTVGKVEGLLVNKAAERVVYLDVEVDASIIEKGHEVYTTPDNEGVHEFLNKDGEDHLILPIGMADLDEENKTVYSNEIDHATFAKTRRYDKTEGVAKEYEIVVYGQYFPGDAVSKTRLSDDEFYNNSIFTNRRSRSSM